MNPTLPWKFGPKDPKQFIFLAVAINYEKLGLKKRFVRPFAFAACDRLVYRCLFRLRLIGKQPSTLAQSSLTLFPEIPIAVGIIRRKTARKRRGGLGFPRLFSTGKGYVRYGQFLCLVKRSSSFFPASTCPPRSVNPPRSQIYYGGPPSRNSDWPGMVL